MEAIKVGKNVKELMQKHHLNIKTLACKMKISPKTLSKKLEGKKEFYVSEIIAITTIFNLDIARCAEIFFDTKKQMNQEKKNA